MTPDDLGIDELPPVLWAAILEFDGWMSEQLLADQGRSTPRAPLYHYTGEVALRGILEKQEIWCFSHNQQSDDTEVRFSLDIARSVIQEEAKQAGSFVRPMLLGLDDMLDNNPLADTFDFYFFSLSSHRDDAEQWATYGQSARGFSIGFSTALFQSDRTEMAPAANENVFVSQVIYGRDATRARHQGGVRQLATIAERVAAANPSLVRGKNRQALFDGLNKSFISSQIIWNCLTAKSERFQAERETRYIMLGTSESFSPWRKEFDRRTYVETSLPLTDRGSIVEILIGRNAPADAEESVRRLLRENAYPEIPIVRSSG